MESEAKTTTATPHRRTRRLWLWFAVGFLLLFVGMLLFVHVFAMHPSGEAAIRYSLWEYYAVSLPRLFRPSYIKPGSLDEGQLFETILTHLLFSSIGGGRCRMVPQSRCCGMRRCAGRPVGFLNLIAL